MFPAALDAVRRLRPELVVFENVPGLTRPSFAPYLDYVKAQLRHPDIVAKDVHELWNEHHERILCSKSEPIYSVYQDLIDAANLGVPQAGVGSSSSLYAATFPALTLGQTSQ